MKYVILLTREGSYERIHPVIFPERQTHSVVAQHWENCIGQQYGFPTEVFSAGFCQVDLYGNYVATQGSESLKLPRNKELDLRDSTMLNQPEAFQGILT